MQDAITSGFHSDVRLATACLLGFAGFLCFDELINLQPCDFELQAEMMSVQIVHGKTDQLCQGESCSGQDKNTCMPSGNAGTYAVLFKDRYVSEQWEISVPANSTYQKW